MRHKWKKRICQRCQTTKAVVAVVGIQRHRELRTYMRPDGIRFTGAAPACEPERFCFMAPIPA